MARRGGQAARPLRRRGAQPIKASSSSSSPSASCHRRRRVIVVVTSSSLRWQVRNRWKRLIKDGVVPPEVVAATEPGFASGAAAPTGGADAELKPPPKKAAPKPKGERVAWSPAEDMRIIESVQQLGLKWSAIEKRLPGRTAHAIRNRFYRLQQQQEDEKKLLAGGGEPLHV